MSHTNRNFVIAYILLVGLPLAGLAGVLRSGRGISAPISIDGTWKVEPSSVHSTGQSCDQALSSFPVSAFAISQSGKTLTLTLTNPAKTSAEGSILGKNLKVVMGTTDSTAAGCAAGQALALTATVVPGSEPRSMSGVVSVSDCPSCAAIEFKAFRQAKSQSGGMH